MKLLTFLSRILGPDSGYPALSGMLFSVVLMFCLVPVFWSLAWLIHWLPWPGRGV